MPYKSVITLNIQPGKNEAFERAFVEAGMLSLPKDIDVSFEGELLQSTASPETYMVIATWASEAAYAEWQRTSATRADAEKMRVLSELLVDPVPGTLFVPVAESD